MEKSLAEVYYMLNRMEPIYRCKIEKEVWNMIKQEYDKKYFAELQKLNKLPQNFSEEALAIMAYLNFKYWCDNKQEKEELKKMYIDNDKNNYYKHKNHK